VEVFLYRES